MSKELILMNLPYQELMSVMHECPQAIFQETLSHAVNVAIAHELDDGRLIEILSEQYKELFFEYVYQYNIDPILYESVILMMETVTLTLVKPRLSFISYEDFYYLSYHHYDITRGLLVLSYTRDENGI